MVKIFISYRRKSSSFTLLLANKLSEFIEAEIFVDFKSIDQADFEKSILGHLRQSDIFLLMVTEHTFAERIHRDDDWVRQEIRLALEANIPIILVCENGLFPPADIPDDIRDVSRKQGIEFYPVYFDAAVDRLVDFLNKVAQIQRKSPNAQPNNLPVPLEEIEKLEIEQSEITLNNALDTLGKAIAAYEQDDYAQSLFLFEALQAINYKAKHVNIDAFVREISSKYKREERKRLAQIDYDEIIAFNTPKALNYAREAFSKWSQEHVEFLEELDTANFRYELSSNDTNIPLKESMTLDGKIEEIVVESQISTREMIQLFREEKTTNLSLAWELLAEIAQRKDMPIYFDIAQEEAELSQAEFAATEVEKQVELEKKRQDRMTQIRLEYEDLVQHVKNSSPETALKAVNRFIETYPKFGDPQNLLRSAAARFLLPFPFDWCEIPAGEVTLVQKENYGYIKNKRETFEVPAFFLSKYPITNAQFAKFMDAGGYKHKEWWTIKADAYKNKNWWTNDGWNSKQSYRWTEPSFWRDSDFNDAEQPVVGVSWYEAVAFCLWLSELEGIKIMLPTEQQWQRAAEGDEGRAYPWGNEWDSSRCNNNVDNKGIGKTSSVRRYEGKGDSPYRVVDMIGNVFEWTLTEMYNGKTSLDPSSDRIFRGASWRVSNTNDFLVYSRFWRNKSRNNETGFRIACSYL